MVERPSSDFEIGEPLPPCSNGMQHRIVLPASHDTAEDFVIGSCLRCGAQKKYPKNPDTNFTRRPVVIPHLHVAPHP